MLRIDHFSSQEEKTSGMWNLVEERGARRVSEKIISLNVRRVTGFKAFYLFPGILYLNAAT